MLFPIKQWVLIDLFLMLTVLILLSVVFMMFSIGISLVFIGMSSEKDIN